MGQKNLAESNNIYQPRMFLSVKRLLTGYQAQFILVSTILFLIASVGSLGAQNVQTGHYAPGWNGNLKAGMMAPDPGFYMQSTTMFYNARKFKDGSGDTATPTRINFICFWMIEIPLAYVLAIPLNMKETGVFWSIVVAETIMTIFAFILFRRGRWKLRQV